MKLKLFIAEKPSLGRAIAGGLGIVKTEGNVITCKNGAVVACCMGHMLQQAEPDEYLPDTVPAGKNGGRIWRMQDLPIIPQAWKKHPIAGKRAPLKAIRDLVAKASEVVVAGDPDREGQLLVEEILEYCKWKGPTLRYWSTGTDPQSVRKALGNLRPNAEYHGLGLAAEARSRADWLVGMNLTRAATLSSGGMVSVGRVQTPVLRLIADRDAAIKNFKPRDFFNVEATFRTSRGSYIGKWKIPDSLRDPEGYLTDRAKAQECIARTQGKEGAITASEQKLKHQAPPIPYDLNELQKECGRRWGYSPKQTLEAAQALYEQHQLTTYPRTSCGYLPSSQQDDVPAILQNISKAFPAFAPFAAKADPKRKSAVWNDKKVSEEAHTGLIPTLKAASQEDAAKLPEACRRIYELICRRYVQVFMPDCAYYETSIETRVGSDLFLTKGRRVVDPGFKAFADAGSSKDGSAGEGEAEVPFIEKGTAALAEKCELKSGTTKPPAPFTQVTIIDAMQNVWKYVDGKREKELLKDSKGIGTVATRADILETIRKRGFVESKGKKCELHATQAGLEALRIIPAELQSAALTANAEDEMQKIQQGAADLAEFVAGQVSFVRRLTAEVSKMAEENMEKCPKCGKGMYRNESKYRKGEYYFRCPECGAMFNDDGGKPGGEIKRAAPRPKFKCPKCGQESVIECVSKKDGSHYGWCTNDKCGAHFDWKDGKPVERQGSSRPAVKCPKCGRQTCSQFTSKKTGKPYWWCRNEKCGAHFSDEGGKPGKEWGDGK